MSIYLPTPYDIVWTQNLIDGLRDGGLWHSPGRGTTYRLDKTNKTFWLVEGENPDLWNQLTAVSARLGYKVKRVGMP